MYSYLLYGYRIFTSCKMDILLPYSKNNVLGEIEIDVTVDEYYSYMKENHIEYYESNGIITLSLGINIHYYIDYINNKFKVITKDIQIFNDTLVNLPFALFFAYRKNELLLHASCILNNGKITAISAEKGVGKSTLVAKMSNYIPLFSDDTVLLRLINNEFYCFSGTNVIKLYKDSFEASFENKSFEGIKKNTQDKALVKIQQSYDKSYLLKNMYILKRDNAEFSISKLKENYTKKFIIMSTIVGINSLGIGYCKLIEKNNIINKLIGFKTIYNLTIINGIKNLENNVKKIINILNNEI